MPWYAAGTIAVTNGSTTVTGTGTDFVNNVNARDALLVGTAAAMEIAAVVSATQLTLAKPWLGATAPGQNYAVQPTSGIAVDLALRAIELLGSYAVVRDGIGQGLIPAGTVAAPGVRFSVDQDTGLRRVAENSVALVGGGADRLTIDAGGNLLVGVASAPVGAHTIAKAGAQGTRILDVNSSAVFYAGASTSFNGAATVLLALSNTTTGRSINAVGTINANGADYAEYMTKAEGCGVIAKGEVCGVDRDGRLTRRWADAIGFVVKSTDPSLVGGDTWSQHLGARQEAPAPDALITHAAAVTAWERADAAWEAGMEAARARVDRIAFCGQVPVNVDAGTLAACEAALADGGATYLVAVARGGGIGVAAVAEGAMSLPQYMRRIGRVWAIRDGRPIVDVQHG